eukprot:5235691-Lingulodinium_polyedra.AAC.1
MDRLAQLEAASTNAFWKHMQSLPWRVPFAASALFDPDAIDKEAARVALVRRTVPLATGSPPP